ncbi:MAG TPA: MerR family transcriptional regulator [Buttiauxella sp.]|nr:MerR family transcriptional regulator [Buttiauxella sp.]
MKIGELSERSGISVRMLRYYEQEGLLRPKRLQSGYREYDDADEQLVRRIRQLSESGLKLGAIKQLMPCMLSSRPGFSPCPEVLATLRREIDELGTRIECLQSSRRALSEYLDDVTSGVKDS